MMNTQNKAAERQEIEALLPWHAAGTLNRRDAQKVEQALGMIGQALGTAGTQYAEAETSNARLFAH